MSKRKTDRVILRKPEPSCPTCGARMVIRMPQITDDWDAFWGCILYPNCKGTRNILSDGRPEDDDWWEDD